MSCEMSGWRSRGGLRLAAVVSLFYLSVCYAVADESYVIQGIVHDAEDKPMDGARVWLRQDAGVTKTETDAAGAFRFEGVHAGATDIVAIKDGYAAGGVSAHVIGSDSVRIVLKPPADFSVRVIDSLLAPVQGVRMPYVIIDAAFRIPVEELAREGFPSVRSNEDGVLLLPFIADGAHVALTLSHHRYAETYVPYLPARKSMKRRNIQIYPGEPLRGRVVDVAGQGIGGVRVCIYKEGAEDHPFPQEVRTDPEGYYRAIVREGDYVIKGFHPEFAPVRQGPFTIRGGLDNVVDLSLETAHVIAGLVLGPDKTPLSGVQVSFEIDEKAVDETRTLANGQFELRSRAGVGRLVIEPPDGMMLSDRRDTFVQIEQAQRIDLKPIQLMDIPEISGRVVTPEGQPGAHTLIASTHPELPFWLITEDDGSFRFRLRRPVPEGVVAFRVEHAQRFWRADFTATITQPVPAEVALAPFEPSLGSNDPARSLNDLSDLVGVQAPALSCAEWLNCAPVNLDALKGKVVVLMFWGGFMVKGPGRDRIEELRALYDLFDGIDDVAFVGVHDSNVEKELADRYMREYQITFPTGLDSADAKTFSAYGVKAMPQTVVIDKEGVVRYFDVEGRLLELIKSLRR